MFMETILIGELRKSRHEGMQAKAGPRTLYEGFRLKIHRVTMCP